MSFAKSERSRAARAVPSGSPETETSLPRGDLDVESVFEKPQVFVVDTEERAEPGLGECERNGVGSDVLARLRRRF